MPHISRRSFLKFGGLAVLGLVVPVSKLKLLTPPVPATTGPWISDLSENWKASLPAAPVPAVPSAFLTAYQLQTPHHALLMDLSNADWTARFTQLVAQGYRPIRIQGIDNAAVGATFSGIWIRDGITPWIELHGLDFNGYQSAFTTYFSQGYRPISVSGYQDSGANVFGAIWAKDSAAYHGIHNASNADYQTFVNTQITDGYMPMAIDGYPIGTADYYISIWANEGGTGFVARHGITSAQYQTLFNTYAGAGYIVRDFSAYEVNGSTYYAAFMVQDSTPFAGRHDWAPASFFGDAVTQTQNDMQPTVVEPYDIGSSRNFGGVWIKRSRTWTATGSLDPNLVAFDSTMKSFMQARHIPSGALAVTKNSRLVLARGYSWDYNGVDPVQPDSMFRIASLTKALTSMAVMQLVQEGKLSLSSKLTSLLSLPVPFDSQVNTITVQNLLQHQGGWNRDTTFDPMGYDQAIASALGVALPITQKNIIDYMIGMEPLQFAPGTDYNYSNFGYCLLGRIIEAVSSMTYINYMKTKIFNKLFTYNIKPAASEFELRQAGEVAYYTVDPNIYANVRHAGGPANAMPAYGTFNIENMDSHGGWLSSAIDLVRFTTTFDPTGYNPILTPASINSIFAVAPNEPFPDGSWYGFGWAVRNVTGGMNTWHNGSLPGTSTLMVRRFDGVNYAVLFNQRDDVGDPTGALYGNIDPLLYSAADSITKWPNINLFPPHLSYIPDVKK